MADSAFTRVKAAIPAHADAILKDYGVRHNHEGTKLKGEWTTGFLCPFCGDKGGSASFTHKLHLKCHQCSILLDVFDWLAKHTGKKPFEVCKELAARLNVQIGTGGRRATRSPRSMPMRMTDAVLQQSMVDLWDHPDAESARKILADRKLDDQVLLSDLGVGWIKGWITFSNRNERGELHDRYRGWNPSSQLKWMWFGAGTGGPSIWPHAPLGKVERVLLLEGESDVLTALVRLRLHEKGFYVCTWTAGATSCPKPRDVPRAVHGKPLWIGYDNDVFQGPNWNDYIIQTKPGKNPAHARAAAENRLSNLLHKVGPLFESLNCDVTLLQCPIDPRENYGGDFRDWVDGGGREISDWPQFPLQEIPEFGRQILDIPFGDVFSTTHKLVRTRVQVEAVARDDVSLATVFEMKCEMGQHPACATCPGARNFPDGMIDMADYQRELVVGLEQQNVSHKIIQDVIQKPRGCPRIEVVPAHVQSASEWRGMQPGKVSDAAQRSLHVFGSDPPSLSGEMEIEGIAYPNARGNGVVFLASKVRALDKAEVDLGPVMQELRNECPSFSDRIEDIDEYLDRRIRDLSFHVTKIHGRRDIHIAHDLLMHSALRAELYGAVQRAWLDICVFGDTRTGKSLTFRRLYDFHGLGVHHTAVSNMSRAGVLMGAGKDGMVKPGLFPRCDRKACMIDEWHFMVQNTRDEHPMSWLQSARDEGVASGVKIYGHRDLPAAVRFVTVANWMRNRRRIFQFDCEHIAALYGAPETVARLDFGLVVNAPPSQSALDPCPQFWTKERTRSLILRAWSQEPDQIIIKPEAAEEAKECCREWRDRFDSEHIPLFTPEEKAHSLLRIAIAIANVCFSHPRHDPYSVEVRRVHVEWAASWLLHTWRLCGYDTYSQKRRDSQQVMRVFEAERMLTVKLDLEDPEIAASRLSAFLTPFSGGEVLPITGLQPELANNWLSKMLALHVLERTRSQNGYHVQYQLTAGGRQMIENLIRLAEHDAASWLERYRAMREWSVANRKSDPDLVPMNGEAWEIFDGGDADGQAVPF